MDAKKRRRALVTEVNPHLICVLCQGYFIEATTIVECLHSFCRSCLVKYLENNKFCPICDLQLHKNNPLLSVRIDPTLQKLVYKLIPGLYSKEMVRRKKYYRELGGGPSSSDSDPDPYPVQHLYFSPEDSISLSLEFVSSDIEIDGSNDADDSNKPDKQLHRRYLQCPAAVNMSHLKKFIRMKYDLHTSLLVDIIYDGENLEDDFSLIDVAYTFNWNRLSPMRFKYKIRRKPIGGTRNLKKVQMVKPILPFQRNRELATVLPQQKSEIGAKNETTSSGINSKRFAAEGRVASSTGERSHNEDECKTSDTKVSAINAPSPKIKEEPLDSRKKTAPEHNVPKPNADIKQSSHESKTMHSPLPPKANLNSSEQGGKNTPSRQEKRKAEEEASERDRKRSRTEPNVNDMDESHDADDEDEERIRGTDDPPQERKESSTKKSERKEKKKSKKAKHHHHHHHRHHDKKKDIIPTEATILSKDDDLMKLKVKLTAIKSENSKVTKYSVVEDFQERKEFKTEKIEKKVDSFKEKKEKRDSIVTGIVPEKKNQTPVNVKSSKIELTVNRQQNGIGQKNDNLTKVSSQPTKNTPVLRKSPPPLTPTVKQQANPAPAANLRQESQQLPSKPSAPIKTSNEVAKIPPTKNDNSSTKPVTKPVTPVTKPSTPLSKTVSPSKTIPHIPKSMPKSPGLVPLPKAQTNVTKSPPPMIPVKQMVPATPSTPPPLQPVNSTYGKTNLSPGSKTPPLTSSALANNQIRKQQQSPILQVSKSSSSNNTSVPKVSSHAPHASPASSPVKISTTINNNINNAVNNNIMNGNVSPKSKPEPVKYITGESAKEKLLQMRAVRKMAPSKMTEQPLKMPPSSITVSKITAEEKRQMEQAKILAAKQAADDESKRPSLEIMLVNGPPAKEELKQSPQPIPQIQQQVQIQQKAPQQSQQHQQVTKKPVRPPPPSIPLSSLNKGAVARWQAKQIEVLDLSEKSSRKSLSPDAGRTANVPSHNLIDSAPLRNLMSISTANQFRNLIPDDAKVPNATNQVKVPATYIPPLPQRTSKPNQNVRHIPNPSALMFRQLNGSLPPPAQPLRNMETMTRNIEKVAAGLKAAYAAK